MMIARPFRFFGFTGQTVRESGITAAIVFGEFLSGLGDELAARGPDSRYGSRLPPVFCTIALAI